VSNYRIIKRGNEYYAEVKPKEIWGVLDANGCLWWVDDNILLKCGLETSEQAVTRLKEHVLTDNVVIKEWDMAEDIE